MFLAAPIANLPPPPINSDGGEGGFGNPTYFWRTADLVRGIGGGTEGTTTKVSWPHQSHQSHHLNQVKWKQPIRCMNGLSTQSMGHRLDS